MNEPVINLSEDKILSEIVFRDNDCDIVEKIDRSLDTDVLRVK